MVKGTRAMKSKRAKKASRKGSKRFVREAKGGDRMCRSMKMAVRTAIMAQTVVATTPGYNMSYARVRIYKYVVMCLHTSIFAITWVPGGRPRWKVDSSRFALQDM